MARAIRDLMTTDPVLLAAATTVLEAARRMRQDDIGDVLVEEDGQLRGIVTDRDIVTRVVADNRAPDEISIGHICSGELRTLSPDDDLEDAVRLLREHAVRRVPIVEGDTAVGILAIGDLAVAKDQTSALADVSAAPGND